MSTLHLPDLISAEVSEDPFSFYRLLRQLDHIHQDCASGWYLLTRYDECAEAFRDPRFTTRNYEVSLEPLHGRTILQMDGVEHSRRRAIVTPFLRGKGLESWLPAITRVVGEVLDGVAAPTAAELLDPMSSSRRVDLVERFTRSYPITVIANMLDLPLSKRDDFHRWYVSIVAYLSNFADDPDITREGERTQRELAEYVLPLVPLRRGQGRSDLISQLADASIEGERMSDQEVKAFVSLLLTAGGETTDKALGSLVTNLLADRSRYEAVLADRELIGIALAETLRFSPPSAMTMRQVSEDVEMRGTVIPSGSRVLLVNASANRDETKFEDSDTFRLDRTDLDVGKAFSAAANHLAFGGGRHYCLGAMLAKAEMEIGLTSILDRFPALRFVDGYGPQMAGIKTRGPVDLMVELA
jgi:cytochrome P450